MNWVFLWKTVLIFTLAIYTILVIIVAIGGVKNIKEMFEDLKV